ncbi:Hypothetical predicted protein [Mytilus galloprovincialis]|uniref:Uncharacterized protein n=1 Tax=Mytilus galloprovincialis TaxID=29158 RepID=A0A8B6C0G7_MYTGA|nr:Hypothetical predicted protein [Mytilus galloprovincialis]
MSQTLEGIVDKDDPELEAFSDISWVVEQKKDEDIARALELKRAGHKPTKREIGVDRDVSQGRIQIFPTRYDFYVCGFIFRKVTL